MSQHWRRTSDVDVSLICIFVDNDSLYGNVGQCNLVVIFLSTNNGECMNFEGADVVMLIVSLIVVCLPIMNVSDMVGS